MPPDTGAAGKALWVGHLEMALLSYEQHEGDVGDDTKIKDEVGGIGGERGPTVHFLTHIRTSEETDDVRNQEEDDVHGNFILTWKINTEFKLIAELLLLNTSLVLR